MILAEKIMELRKKNGWSPAGRGIYGESQKIDRKTEKWAAIYWPLVTAVYLGYSLYTFDWGRSWIIWPVAAVFSAVLKAIFGESEEM